MSKQITNLEDIYEATEIEKPLPVPEATILEKSKVPYLTFTTDECKKKLVDLKADLKSDAKEEEDGSNFDNDDLILDDEDDLPALNIQTLSNQEEKHIALSPEQRAIINKLKLELDKSEQLLAMVQGEAGSGKTTMARTFTKELNLKTIFSATTGTAAAPLKARTINSLLALGLSLDFVDLLKDTTTRDTKAKIQRRLRNVKVLIIDEISMCTPVTLSRIENRLRECFDSEKPFGGLHVILLGDFWQFEPVSRMLKKPALYQGLVLQARKRRLEKNRAYSVGLNIFSTFKVYKLSGQQRVKDDPDFYKFLSVLRDVKKKTPITTSWVSQLQTLSKSDVDTDEEWEFATVATTGNVERVNIIKYQAKRYAAKNNEPVLTWRCPVRKKMVEGKNVYEELDMSHFSNSDQFCVLDKYFVRGGKCVIGENTCTTLGLGKGTTGTFMGLVWEDNEKDAPDITRLPKGKIARVPQPSYILVEAKGYTIPIKTCNAKLYVKGGKNKAINYLNNPVDLLFAVTFHKLQGLTLDKVILSIGHHPTFKLRVEIASLYVGASRVHSFKELRILPCKPEKLIYLTKLKRDPLLGD